MISESSTDIGGETGAIIIKSCLLGWAEVIEVDGLSKVTLHAVAGWLLTRARIITYCVYL